ncbi:MAG TPA: type VI secretion system baseplate subunit TssK [Terriglobia bacterium]|nr:type VI secretion system baseplate subunit TssK [Terriglobia bacterium]
MRQLQPVIWSKGTFLTPQHLQSQDRFIENTLDFRLNALSFRPWGLETLQIDQEALAGGSLALSQASGILPDGLAFDIPNSDPAPPARPLAQSFEADSDELDVFLAVPAYRDHGVNISTGGLQRDARYLAEVVMLKDENSGAAEKPVQLARKNFRLLVEGEPLQGMASLHVARVRRSADNALQLDPGFVPPLLDVAASGYILGVLRGLVEILAAKSSILGGMRRQRNQNLAEFSAADVANFWLLYTVNTYFPVLRHVLQVRRGHPEALFAELNSLAGALTAFSFKIQPRDLPTYNHDELGACFKALDEKLRELLETVVPANFVSLPLKLTRPSIYSTALADDRYLKNTKMYLAVSSEAPEEELIKRVPQLVKVCSETHIDTLIRQALGGVPLTHTPSPPTSLPIKLSYQYFSLSQSGPSWEAVCRARNLAAYVPADLPNPQMELLILLPEPLTNP